MEGGRSPFFLQKMILHRLRREGQNIAGAIFSFCPASTFKGPSLLSTSKLMLEWKKYRRADVKQFSSTNLELQHRQALFCWVPWITDFADPKLRFTPFTQWGPSCIGNAQPKVMSVMRKRRKKSTRLSNFTNKRSTRSVTKQTAGSYRLLNKHW